MHLVYIYNINGVVEGSSETVELIHIVFREMFQC